METNRLLFAHAFEALSTLVYSEITAREPSIASFTIQERVYAAKLGHHLRRTHKLDPVAEFFLYDVVYRHRSRFRKHVFANRRVFGYRFENGAAKSALDSYREFRKAVNDGSTAYKCVAKFDISTYFNSVYHHDLSNWFADFALTEDDSLLFAKFFRQINAGRSIDCLVHGLYPAKLLGTHFLSFVDNHPGLESELTLRFLDDFVLYSNDSNKLKRDFLLIQKLLGEKGLSVNPSKTYIGDSVDDSIERQMDPVRAGLLKRRRLVVRSLYSDDDVDEEEDQDEDGEGAQADSEYGEDEDADEQASVAANQRLSPQEERYLLGLLSGTLEEADADLILSYLRDRGNDLLEHLSTILWRFPYLSKHVFHFSAYITDKSGLLNALDDFVTTNPVLSEYSLFWTAHIVEARLLDVKGVGSLITRLYEHPEATRISKAKILEIADKRHGLKELREEVLRTGSSDWLSWSAAVGSRSDSKQARNHLLTYFGNGSMLNRLIADCVKTL